MIALTIFITGHVQGVFFREWIVAKARELGVIGWVRNLSDGRWNSMPPARNPRLPV